MELHDSLQRGGGQGSGIMPSLNSQTPTSWIEGITPGARRSMGRRSSRSDEGRPVSEDNDIGG
jgi:hypothetical protein